MNSLKTLTFFCIIIFTIQNALSQVVQIDSRMTGRIFEGIGALSAGASSRLLIDYPEPQRSVILDYLFKPQFGASIHHLKVEIGGDVNSTCGTEPSHMHHRGEDDYTRGYEWWLMKEAKMREPSITLDALAWGAPYWIGDGTYYSLENAEYMAKFVKGAKDVHGLTIDYIGCWNETAHDVNWLKTLRKSLDQYQLPTKIVVADGIREWTIANDLINDDELFSAVDVIGTHYCQGQDRQLYNGKTVWQNYGEDYRIVTPEALQSGKTLWSGEDGPWKGDWNGAKGIIKTLVRNYIEARMTKTIIWSLITSYYDVLPLPNSGLIMANTPWSGHFELCPALWAMAHVGQFTQPGWTFLEGNANGYMQTGGSYISLMSPDRQDVSIIIETTEARSGQHMIFAIDPLWHNKTFHIWKTDSVHHFIEQQSVAVANGHIALNLSSGSIYTISTTTGQRKADYAGIPQARKFPLPYIDDFESYPPNRLPKYTIDQSGVFETAMLGRKKILRQQIPQIGIEWPGYSNAEPYTILGDNTMDDYSICIDVLLAGKGQCVDLMGRIKTIPEGKAVRPCAYWLRIESNGTYELCKTIYNNEKPSLYQKIVLASGKIIFPLKKWNNVKLTFEGKLISANFNGKILCNIEDTSYESGLAGFGCGWHIADFDNLKIDPVEPVKTIPERNNHYLPATP